MTENGGFGEGSGIFFAFLIFALFAFGGGAWSGWGRNGFNGAGAVAADIGIQSQLDNIQAQNFYNSLNNGIAGITAGNAAIANKIDQNTISALQTENARLYADKSNLVQSIGFGERFCGLEKQLAACCCQTQNDLNLILSKLPTSTTTTA